MEKTASITKYAGDKANPTKVISLKQLTFYFVKYIKLSWAKVSGAKGYKIYRATSKNGTYKLIKTTTKTSFKNEKINRWKIIPDL